MNPVHDATAPNPLPVKVHGGTVSVRGPLTASTIALICAAVDYLHDVGSDAITVDLRAMRPFRVHRTMAAQPPATYGSDDRVVRLLLPLQAT